MRYTSHAAAVAVASCLLMVADLANCPKNRFYSASQHRMSGEPAQGDLVYLIRLSKTWRSS